MTTTPKLAKMLAACVAILLACASAVMGHTDQPKPEPGCWSWERKDREDDTRIYCVPDWNNMVGAYNTAREVVGGMAPEQDRCAMALSAALKISPNEGGGASMSNLPRGGVHSAFQNAGVLPRYYIRAVELKQRLERQAPFGDRGKPPEFYADSKVARVRLAGRRGVIYFEGAVANPERWTSLFDWSRANHIDLWDGERTVTGYPYRKAREIWFWEFPE